MKDETPILSVEHERPGDRMTAEEHAILVRCLAKALLRCVLQDLEQDASLQTARPAEANGGSRLSNRGRTNGHEKDSAA